MAYNLIPIAQAMNQVTQTQPHHSPMSISTSIIHTPLLSSLFQLTFEFTLFFVFLRIFKILKLKLTPMLKETYNSLLNTNLSLNDQWKPILRINWEYEDLKYKLKLKLKASLINKNHFTLH